MSERLQQLPARPDRRRAAAVGAIIGGVTMSFLFVILAAGLALPQAATPLERFKAETDHYGKMRIIGEAVTGKTPASPSEVQELLEAAIRDNDVSVRRAAIGSIASILHLNALPTVPDGQQWAVPLRETAEVLRPRLDDGLKDDDCGVRQEALRGIVGPVAWANPRAPLPFDLLSRLARLFDIDPCPPIRASVLAAFRTSYGSADPERVALAKHILLRALEDSDPYVVQAAGWGAGDARYAEALPLLVQQLRNRSSVARMGVAAGLQAYASQAQRYLPELEAALAKEPDGPARKTLEATIARIRSGRQ